MNRISKYAAHAFMDKKPFSNDNTKCFKITDSRFVMTLNGHMIARNKEGIIYLFRSFYLAATSTSKNRLNAILEVGNFKGRIITREDGWNFQNLHSLHSILMEYNTWKNIDEMIKETA